MYGFRSCKLVHIVRFLAICMTLISVIFNRLLIMIMNNHMLKCPFHMEFTSAILSGIIPMRGW